MARDSGSVGVERRERRQFADDGQMPLEGSYDFERVEKIGKTLFQRRPPDEEKLNPADETPPGRYRAE